MNEKDKEYIRQLAKMLDKAERKGTETGVEGTEYIRISVPLAKEVGQRLRIIVDGL